MVDSIPRASKLDLLPASKSASKSYPLPDKRFPLWWRSLVGVAYISLGGIAASVGLASVSYRLTHLTVNGGMINGRTVRVQAPVDGEIQSFYARPGARVQAGQVLAQMTQMTQQLQNSSPMLITNNDEVTDEVTDIQLPDQPTDLRLASAEQTLALLNQQLEELSRQEQLLQTASAAVASEEVDYSDATLTAAIAQEAAARNRYERFESLLQKGAVSQQEVDELAADWRSRQATVQQARSEQSIAQINANALANQVPIEGELRGLQSQRQRLMLEIERQQGHVDGLMLALEPQALPQDTAVEEFPNSSLIPILAPFEGVVYTTHYDLGEQVNRPTTMLSILDCNAVWVETLVSADQARRIDASHPVRIQYEGQSETLVGNVDFITAVSAGEITKARAEALLPAVPPNLKGQSIARVRVSMPPTSMQENAYQFCGVGSSARLTFGTQGSSPAQFLHKLFRRH